MSSLRYHLDWEAARERLTAWWPGGDIGRPAMQLTVPRATPWEDIAALPEPEGWVTHYSSKSLEYRVSLARRDCLYTTYLAEGVPFAAPGDLGPGCVSLYLGCQGHEMPGTTWFEPCLTDPETARFEVDRDNFCWQFSLAAHRATLPHSQGRFLQQYPDLIEGLDVLSAMRGNQALLVDLIERPEWVHHSLRQITDRFFYYYDVLYDLIRDEVGGSVFWAWAPGRMVKLQCDFSAMISPAMFDDFMRPVLTEMTERTAHSMYHLDGPDAIRHLDVLLDIPRLNMIQWTPGAGQPHTDDPCWFPMYHRIIAAGKTIFLWVTDRERLEQLKREFGADMKRMMVNMSAPTVEAAAELVRVAEC